MQTAARGPTATEESAPVTHMSSRATRPHAATSGRCVVRVPSTAFLTLHLDILMSKMEVSIHAVDVDDDSQGEVGPWLLVLLQVAGPLCLPGLCV